MEPEFQHLIPEGQRHITMLSFADSLLIKHRNRKSKEDLKTFFLLVNDSICLPPLLNPLDYLLYHSDLVHHIRIYTKHREEFLHS